MRSAFCAGKLSDIYRDAGGRNGIRELAARIKTVSLGSNLGGERDADEIYIKVLMGVACARARILESLRQNLADLCNIHR